MFMKKSFSILIIIALLVPSPHVFAQQKFDLTVDNIMRGPGLIGYEPSAVRWSQDSQRVYFRWKQASEPRTRELDTYTVNRDGSGLKKLTEDEARNQAPSGGDLTKDKKLSVYVEDGDVFVYDHVKRERRQITATTDVETNAGWGQDQKSVIFNRAGNLFKLSLEGGAITQLTDFRTGGGDALAQAPPIGGGGGGGGRGGLVVDRGRRGRQAARRQERREQRRARSISRRKKRS